MMYGLGAHRCAAPEAVINAYNRLNVILQRPGGDYQPGQWG
jgi:hypothetical protein